MDTEKKTAEHPLKKTAASPVETVLEEEGLVNLIAHNTGLAGALNLAKTNTLLHENVRPYAPIEENLERWEAKGTLVANCCLDLDHARVALHNPAAYGISFDDFLNIAGSHPALRKRIIREFRIPESVIFDRALLSPKDFAIALSNPKTKTLLKKYFRPPSFFVEEFLPKLNSLGNFFDRWKDSFNDFPEVREFILSENIFCNSDKRRMAREDFDSAIYYLTHDPGLFTNRLSYVGETREGEEEGPWFDLPVSELNLLFEQQPDLVKWAVTQPEVCKSLPWRALLQSSPRVAEIALLRAQLHANPFNLRIADWVHLAVKKPEWAGAILHTFHSQLDGKQLKTILETASRQGVEIAGRSQFMELAEAKKTSPRWPDFFPKDNKDSKKTRPEIKVNPASTSHASGGTSTTSSVDSLPLTQTKTPTLQ